MEIFPVRFFLLLVSSLYYVAAHMRFDHLQDFMATWFLWIGLQVIGTMFGMIFGEALGQWIATTFTLSAGHFAAFLIFEIAIWIPRRLVFRTLFFDPTWKKMTQWIWVVTEIFAWSIGSQLLRTATTPHLTEGAAFGAVIGAALWFLLWCAQQARRTRWWFLVATFYAFGGMIIGNSVAVIAFTLGDELHRILSLMVHPLVAEAGMGVIIGLGIGSLTGGVIARQQLSVAPPSPIR